MNTGEKIKQEMMALADESQARQLMRFFKTGKGEYGEGDRFLGIKVPVSRSIVKKYRKEADLDDVELLTQSKYHEIRLVGLLLLNELYERTKRNGNSLERMAIVEYYLSILDRGNNWDLVDLVSYKLLGDWLVSNRDKRDILDLLADKNGQLWHQRVAIVTTFAMIHNGEYEDTIRIASKLINHPHDLIHKAVGWMLREMGKRGGQSELTAFLDQHAPAMPRTMLRYAIEHLVEAQRQHYLKQY